MTKPLMILLVMIFSINHTSSLQWGRCNDTVLTRLSAQCALLDVPLDYNNPNGTQIQIALSRIRSNVTGSSYQGVILLNPGGPGGSGLRLVSLKNGLSSTVAQTYDWIGFDPRGVGASRPALSCMSNMLQGPRPSYIPLTTRDEQYWINRTRVYAQACASRHSAMLSHMTTLDTVRDMESIRVALSQSTINFYGFSYGTYLGQVYATLYPNRIRRMVLDSNVDPRYIWYASNLRQNPGFDRNFRAFFTWVAKYNTIYKLGETVCSVEQKWLSVEQALKTNPINGIIGPAEWRDSFLIGGYTQTVWPYMALAFSDWSVRRNPSSIMTLYSVSNSNSGDNSLASYLAVICSDLPWPSDWDAVRIDLWRSYASSSLFSWENGWFNGPCQYWTPNNNVPVRVNGNRTGGILLIGGTYDAATPYAGNIEVRRRFPQARLVGIMNERSHGVSLSGNRCVDTVVSNYLRSGSLPVRRLGDVADVSCNVSTTPVPLSKSKLSREDMIDLTIIRRLRPMVET